VKPGPTLVDEIAALAPARTVVNLATPGAFDALVALREAGIGTRFWGCIAAASHDRTLALGMIEPAVRPLDLERLVAALAGYAQKGTRLVTAGTDNDALMSLRHALARQGVSVSMAWNGAQAADLLETVHPELVLIDLKLRGAHKLVAGLAAATPVPHTVLVRGDDDGAAAFAAALAAAAADATMGLERYLVDTVAQRETLPAPERAGKVGALPK